MAKKKIPPLIIEKISNENNLFFMSIIEYRREEFIGIINDITSTHLKAYILDNVKPNSISDKELLSHAIKWFYFESSQKPLSVSLSKEGLTELTSPFYKSFDLGGVSRVVGNPFMFPHLTSQSTKRKKVLPIPEYVQITLKKN